METLDDFFTFIYGDLIGVVCISLLNPETGEFDQYFFNWPTDMVKISNFVAVNNELFNVYFGVAVHGARNGRRSSIIGSNVVWVEFDHGIPDDLEGISEPSLKIQSSLDTKQHWYWKLTEPIGADEIEKITRGLTYKFKADHSGWDAAQILRPPGTLNHKYPEPLPVRVLEVNSSVHSPKSLTVESPPRLFVETINIKELPDLTNIIAKYKWPADAFKIFRTGDSPLRDKVGSGRSSVLMMLGYYLAEMQLTSEEMLTVLMDADLRWGKFAKRSDRLQRLAEIVTLAKDKYPSIIETRDLVGYGFNTLLAVQVRIDWVVEGLIHQKGYALSTGRAGVGKSTLSLQVAEHIALGKDILGFQVKEERRVGFFSLEMGIEELKSLIEQQVGAYTKSELEILEKNLILFPLGESIYLNRDSEKNRIEELIHDYGLNGIFIDSLGSTSDQELTNESAVKNIMDWNDRIRQRMGIFTWYIHHNRKATSSNDSPKGLDDVFGSHYLTARATSVINVWPTNLPDVVELSPLKLRLARKWSPFLMKRTDTGTFIRQATIESTTNKVRKFDI